MAIITKIEVQKKNKDRVNIFLDGEYAFSISMELVYKEGLKTKMEVNTVKLKEVAVKEGCIRCKDSALRIIERSCKTEKEVRNKLILNGYEDYAIEKSVEFLKKYNFINDKNYVKTFINDKLSSRGKQKIKYDLINKGISKEIIDEELSNIDSNKERDIALILANKKIKTIRKSETDDYKVGSKLYRFLISKGYGYDIVKDVVKEAMSLEISKLD